MKTIELDAERVIFKSNYNENKFPREFHKNELPSETVPGMSMSITEIIRRCASGINPPIQHNVIYDGESQDLDFDNLDPTTVPDFDLADADEIERFFERKKQNTQQPEPQTVKPKEGEEPDEH